MTFAEAAASAAHIAQQLGWAPDTFWAATPADLRNALGPLPADEAASSDVLARLIKEFPDG